MTSHRHFFLALSLTAAAGFFAPVAQAQQDFVLKLDYGNGATCDFNTGTTGWGMSGGSTLNATGSFVPTSNCPTGGGDTGDATVTLLPAQATIAQGDQVNVTWSARADVCRFDGSTLPPGGIVGWDDSGYACVGVSKCLVGGSIDPVFDTGGSYSLKLSCESGTPDDPQKDVANATSSIVVTGGPPTTSCVAPAGLTRAKTGQVALSSGAFSGTVNVEHWSSVFGRQLGPSGATKNWPGPISTDLKLNVKKNQYWAMQFTVPWGYPPYGTKGWMGTYGPYGGFSSNETLTTAGVLWTLSITKDCGDFSVPASGPKKQCFKQYTPATSESLLWGVAPEGQYAASNICTLNPGETYYLNILPAPLGDPLNTSGNGCNQATCVNNYRHGGNFDGTQLP